MKIIGITGGSGFVGQHLTRLLISKGYRVVIFTRQIPRHSEGNVSYAHWDAVKQECDNAALRSIDAIVNLAGAGIADKRWTEARKKEITNSRINSTRFLVRQLEEHAPQCKIFIGASATGFYGADNGKEPFKETVEDPAKDFLGNVCNKWEMATRAAKSMARTVILRFGIVLGKESGAFPKFATPVSLGIKPVLGSGRQIVSWIEVDDLSRMILFCIENDIWGVHNAVAPHPVSHRVMMDTIAKVKGGPHIPIPVPGGLLKVAMGEMAEEILKSCTVSAERILRKGFVFNNPDITTATKAILGKE